MYFYDHTPPKNTKNQFCLSQDMFSFCYTLTRVHSCDAAFTKDIFVFNMGTFSAVFYVTQVVTSGPKPPSFTLLARACEGVTALWSILTVLTALDTPLPLPLPVIPWICENMVIKSFSITLKSSLSYSKHITD